MTTGRINQVAAFCPNRARGPDRSNGVRLPFGRGVSSERSALPCFGPTPNRLPKQPKGGGCLFLESPLSVPPPSPNESEATPPGGVGTPAQGGLPAGVGAAPASRGGQGPNKRPSTPPPFWQPANWYACTSCIDTSSPSPTAPWPFSQKGSAHAADRFQSAAAIDEAVGWVIHLPHAAAGGLITPRLTVTHRTTQRAPKRAPLSPERGRGPAISPARRSPAAFQPAAGLSRESTRPIAQPRTHASMPPTTSQEPPPPATGLLNRLLNRATFCLKTETRLFRTRPFFQPSLFSSTVASPRDTPLHCAKILVRFYFR